MSEDEIDYLEEVQPRLMTGDAKGALTMAEKALAHDSKDHQAWRIKGMILQMLGRNEEADDALARAALHDESGIDTKIGQAMEKAMAGDAAGALQIYQELLNEDDSLYEVWSAAAMILSETGQKEESVKAAQRAVQLAHEEPSLHFTLGHCLRLAGRSKEALESFSKTLDRDPTHGLAWYEKGMVLEQSGDLKGSLSCYDQMLALSPDDPVATQAKEIITKRIAEQDGEGQAQA